MFTLDLDYDAPVESGADYCTQYSIQRVAGTNMFLGVVNKTCHMSTSFCWCSTLDRSCLDCSRVSQDECECPCECSDDRSTVCSADSDDIMPVCPPSYQAPDTGVRYSTVRLDQLPPCIHTDCQSRHTLSSCHGVLGCSWCQYSHDMVTPLVSPHCSRQEMCYSGIMGYPSPYSVMSGVTHHTLASEADRNMSRSSPIGPVAGGIMAFFVLLALTGWAYRHWSRGERRLLVSGTDQDRVIMDAGYEEDSPDDGPGHSNYGLHHNSISVVSPYKMNPGYRRPRPAGTDSDHGYSTMTPGGDQDSEIMSCLGSSINQPRIKTRSGQPASQHSVTSGNNSGASSPVFPSDTAPAARKHSVETAEFSDDNNDDVDDCVTSLKQLGRNQIVVAATIHSVET